MNSTTFQPNTFTRPSTTLKSRPTKTFAFVAALTALTALLLLTGCSMPHPQRGGTATSVLSRPGRTNSVTLAQSENPKEPSRQAVESEQTIEYVLPPGTAISLGDRSWEAGVEASQTGLGDGSWKTGDGECRTTNSDVGLRDHGTTRPRNQERSGVAILNKPMPVRVIAKDRTETSIGGAQKDTLREWAGKAANLQPVMWAGIAMMTLVAGVLVYFGWWTKAAVAVVVGLGMVVLAQTLPDHGTIILLGGLGVFAVAALLVLYAYHKGQLDQNNNGIPDFLERQPTAPDGKQP